MKENQFILPEAPEIKKEFPPPSDLVIAGIPKVGKSTIVSQLTLKGNGIVFDLERGGYEYISARRVGIYNNNSDTLYDAYCSYINWRNALLREKNKYKFLIIDNISVLNDLAEIGGTYLYMDSVQGSSYNRVGKIKNGKKLSPNDKEWESVAEFPNGYGYKHIREWFFNQIELFSTISPYRIYIAHVKDKALAITNDNEISVDEIMLTGKIKILFPSKVTAICRIVPVNKENVSERYLDFTVGENSIIAGSRHPDLNGQILISSYNNETKKLETYWEKIYKDLK